MYKFLKVLACLGILGISQQANAAGFALQEQSASGLGTAYAGTAAVAEDATTVWSNPAGMTRFCYQQAAFVVPVIFPSFDYHDRGSTLNLQLGEDPIPLSGNDGRNAGMYGVVPSTYYVKPLDCGLAVGLAINTPFGLSTSYAHDWKGRYYARHAKLMTVNIQPTIAYQICDNLSIGAGFNATYIRAKLTTDIDFGTILFALTQGQVGIPQGDDGESKLRGDSWGFGGNFGVLWDVNCCTRLGLAYRTEIKQTLRGNVSYKNVPGLLEQTFQNSRISANVTLPSALTFSALHHINSCWDVVADVTWTKWSSLKHLRIKYKSGQEDTTETLKWKDSMRYALGTTYQYWDCLKLRFGVQYDEGATPNQYYRTPRLPDTNRFWVACGFGYMWNCFNFDVGYAHIFAKDPKINRRPSEETFFKGHLIGKYKVFADILAVQVSYSY
jgi:long-chain fatty acid transport protein